MKKILVSVLAVIAFSMTSNAQLWFGGSISARHTGGVEKKAIDPMDPTKTTDIDAAKTNAFAIAPKIGFALSEKFSVGAALNFSTSTTGKIDKNNLTKNNAFGVEPFVRYTFAEFGNFGVLAEASLPIDFTFLGITSSLSSGAHILSSSKIVSVQTRSIPVRFLA